MKVLVVEDEKRLAAAVKRGLQSEGFSVDIALDGTEGGWLAAQNAYDAIVLDVMSPGVNGFKLCADLRDEGNWTPILMLTAKDGELDEAEALDTGADDLLSKPFSLVALVARLQALLHRGAVERPSVLTCGDLRLDPSAHVCTRGDILIDLTAKEFTMLEYLMRRAGEVVAKAEILDHLWDCTFEGGANLVEVHISTLRRKVDVPFDCQSIQTIRGVGYKLVRGHG
ncbi:MAG: response regulator transcription factor [Actinomycetota bacterium]|nr:response regulator transcription factor [Actinomycetota bacterium]